MSEELLPCPFCGNGCTRDVWYVLGMPKECVKCGARGPMVSDVATWGQRTDYFASLRATNECLRLQRENEKYRRKLAKRRWLHTADQGDADPGHIFEDLIYATWVIMWRNLEAPIRTWIVRSQMKIEMQKDRHRNPELLRFLKWQDNFCSSNEVGDK